MVHTEAHRPNFTPFPGLNADQPFADKSIERRNQINSDVEEITEQGEDLDKFLDLLEIARMNGEAAAALYAERIKTQRAVLKEEEKAFRSRENDINRIKALIVNPRGVAQTKRGCGQAA
jgi:hypothetical protein